MPDIELKIAVTRTRAFPSLKALQNIRPHGKSAVPAPPSKKLIDIEKDEHLATFSQHLRDSEGTTGIYRNHNNFISPAEASLQRLTGQIPGCSGTTERLVPIHQYACRRG